MAKLYEQVDKLVNEAGGLTDRLYDLKQELESTRLNKDKQVAVNKAISEVNSELVSFLSSWCHISAQASEGIVLDQLKNQRQMEFVKVLNLVLAMLAGLNSKLLEIEHWEKDGQLDEWAMANIACGFLLAVEFKVKDLEKSMNKLEKISQKKYEESKVTSKF